MKIALVQDWFVVDGGAEKVVKEILSLYPEASVFSLVDFLNEKDRKAILNGKKVTTSYLQHFPFARKHYRKYLPFFPSAIESLNLDGFDLIISSSYSVAKGVKKSPNQYHVCYCHSPVRYAWDLEEEYLDTVPSLLKPAARMVLDNIRNWDLKTTERVDLFIANSKNIAERIQRIYKRNSTVIYPPVDTTLFTPEEVKEDYYFTTLRVVPYKKLDLIISAFNETPQRKLIVSGDGPGLKRMKQAAGSNIRFVGFVDRPELVKYMQKAKAFVLAAEEDFGITSLEAQSCCTPVIAYRKGGYLETVVENKTGIFFDQQTKESLKQAIEDFEQNKITFIKQDFLDNVANFTVEKFRTAFKNCIASYVEGTDK